LSEPFEDKPGDFNRDGNTDLADAIIALQICTGIKPTVSINKTAEVNGDARIGVEDAIYILQQIAIK